jgi:hypothetical protein
MWVRETGDWCLVLFDLTSGQMNLTIEELRASGFAEAINQLRKFDDPEISKEAKSIRNHLKQVCLPPWYAPLHLVTALIPLLPSGIGSTSPSEDRGGQCPWT